MVYGAGHIAADIEARLIVVASHSGATALALSKQRLYVPIVGVSDSSATLRQMCLYWGVIPLADAPTANQRELLDSWSTWGRDDGCLHSGDHVVLVAGVGLGSGTTIIMVRVHRCASENVRVAVGRPLHEPLSCDLSSTMALDFPISQHNAMSPSAVQRLPYSRSLHLLRR